MPSHDALQPKIEASQGGRRDATDAGADPRPHAVSQALALEGRDEAVDVVEGDAPATSLARDAIYRRSLALADLIAATFAFAFTIEVLGADSLGPWTILAVMTIVPVCKLAGLYDRDEHRLHKTTLDEAPALFRVAALYTLLAFLAGGAIVEGTFGRTQAAVLWVLLFISMLVGRWLARAVAGAIVPKERCVIISNAEAAHWLNTKLARCNGARIEVVGRVPISPGDTSVNELPLLGSFDRMEELLAAYNVDRALIAPGTGEGGHQLLNVIRVVKRLGVRVSVLPRLFEAVGSAYEFDEVEGATLLGVRRHGLSRSSYLIKRSFDLVIASIVAVALAPLMAMIAIAIKLDSRGPVFFRQRRMGCEDRVFKIFKFRTMVADAEERKAGLGHRNEAGGGLFKIEDDPRITRVGRFLRRTSLDELPQLLNVLHGDMSLVGPRPLVLDEDRLIEGLHRHRLLVPPGVTGLWQVFGSARIPLNEMVKIDYLYGANWSLWLDVKILLRTVPVVLGRRGL
jgi:exopolysaccharide biosynthesis polyprenyl glycosylphosphotransferase